jgi:hypothetical protein
MSDFANRSFERITRDDLMRLAQLASVNFKDFFARNLGHAYSGQLRLICLIQSAAKHYVDPDQCVEPDQKRGGVNDFDVCGFFQAIPGQHLFAQRRCKLDFGLSKFGRNPEEGEHFKGRRVDVLWRSINMQASEAPIESVQRHLRDAHPKSSAKFWAAKPVVVLWPSKDFDRTIWRPCQPPTNHERPASSGKTDKI